MKFDLQGIASVRIAISSMLLDKFFGSGRAFRYLENEILTSSSSSSEELLHSFDEGDQWFPRPDFFLSAPKSFRGRALYRIQNAQVDSATGYIYDSHFKLLADFISWSVPAALADRPALPLRPVKVKNQEDSLFLGTQGFYHWLIEDFPAYLLAKKAIPDSKTYVKRRSPSFVKEALNLLQEDFSELPVSAVIPSLIAVSKGVALVPNEVDLNVLREFGNSLETSGIGPQKIYISRRDSGRMPENETEIEALLVSRGFELVQLTQYSLLEQITLFKNVRMVIGTHGAGLANLAWCDPKATKVIEIKLDRHPKCFEWLAEVAGMDYHKVEDQSVEKWKVEIPKLIKILDDTEGKS